MDNSVLNDYFVKTTVTPNYSYFIPDRKYVPVWKDYNFGVKLEVISQSEEMAALAYFDAVPFNLVKDYAMISKLCQRYSIIGADLDTVKDGVFVRLNRVFVAPGFRGHGLATAILKKFPEIMARQIGWKIKLVAVHPAPFVGMQNANGKWEITSSPICEDYELNEKLLLLYFNSGFTDTHGAYYWRTVEA